MSDELTELLWRKKRLLSGASRVQTVLLYEPKLKAELKTAEDSNFNVLETGDVKDVKVISNTY
uniref:Uncharacterized protein n=1 Tax=Timema genevievae TaxID=629358 RepID=A0A7R9PIR9_TIMGE|nr:unnamed protein product [Timema genevievae]